MKLLVTGGAGFIGSNFVRYIVAKYPKYSLINYDKLTYAGNLDNLKEVEDKPNYKFVKGDIVDLELLNKVIKDNQITHLINFAAETHVDRSIHGGAKEFVLTNTLGTQMLLDATRFNNLERMVNVSTDEVYGALGLDEKRKFTESTPILPNMPYAAAKAGGDLMCNAYWATHKTPVIVTHCSNNYGSYQYPEKLIPYFIFKAMAGEKLPIYGDGLYIRDWIHVLDHAKALDLLLHKGVLGEVYNIGSDNERSNLEITKLILKFLNKPEDQYESVADRPGHDRRYAIDAAKILKLGWKPDYPREKFEGGLKETIAWYQENTKWVENLWERAKVANPHINESKNKFVLAELAAVSAPNFTMNWGDLKTYLPIADFNLKRVYFIDSPKAAMATGQHSHKDDESEVFIVLSGAAVAVIDDDASGKKEIPIKKNNIMWIPRMVWHGFIKLSPDFVIMALTTTNYDPDRKGYVTDYEEFKTLMKGTK